MSDNTPTFTEALETLAKALNINFSTLAGDLFEDVELAKEAFLKRAKAEKSNVEKDEVGAQSPKFNSVDFWPAMNSTPEDLDAALHKLGVDKPDDEESVDEVLLEARRRKLHLQQRLTLADVALRAVENGDEDTIARIRADLDKKGAWGDPTFHVQDLDEAFKKVRPRNDSQLENWGVLDNESEKPAVDDEPALSKWDVAIRDRNWASWAVVEAETLDIEDEGIFAYKNDELVFHAPAGTYHYVRKVA